MEKSKEFLMQEQIYKEIERIESEIKSLEYDINIIGKGKRYLSEFPLDKDDYIALMEVRKRKINELTGQ